eukprot:gene11804-biopygen3001
MPHCNDATQARLSSPPLSLANCWRTWRTGWLAGWLADLADWRTLPGGLGGLGLGGLGGLADSGLADSGGLSWSWRTLVDLADS